MKAIFVLTIFLLFCQMALAQEPQPTPSTGVEEIYLAKDDGEGKAGDQVTEEWEIKNYKINPTLKADTFKK